ncbi:MAG: hypothetical protein U0169_08490 [Polyangiaceae bacterium]
MKTSSADIERSENRTPTWIKNLAGHREGGAIVGALSGIAAGAMVGPVGMFVGGAVGSLMGYAVGEAMRAEEAIHAAHDRNLDRQLGVTASSGVGLNEKGREGIVRHLSIAPEESAAESRRRVEALAAEFDDAAE